MKKLLRIFEFILWALCAVVILPCVLVANLWFEKLYDFGKNQ